jgi:hypothetical protein
MDSERENRRDSRVQTNIACSVVHALGDVSSAVVLDISKRGFRIRLLDAPEIGDVIRLLVDGCDNRGQIVWVRGGEAGGIFLDEAAADC